MIKAVVFDIGNVLIEWQPEKFYDAHFGIDRRRAFFDQVPMHAIHEKIDAGGNYVDILGQAKQDYPNWVTEITCWHEDWNGLASKAIDGTVQILKALDSRGIQLITLTNFGSDFFKLSHEHHTFLQLFHTHYVSGDLGLIKPDPAIYKVVEDQTGFKPAHLLFTDDREENIDAARLRGWQTHLFKSPEGWENCLIQQGLLDR